MTRIGDAMSMVYQVLKTSLGRSDQVDSCYERVATARARLDKLLDVHRSGVSF